MEIYKKLLKVQQEVGAVSKDATNPFFKSKYFDINGLIQHVEPILSMHGLVLLQPIQDGKQYSIITDCESGESVSSYLELPILNDPQKLGSAVTYYRRYTLCSLLALQAEDDDANIASKESKKPVKKVVTDYDGLLNAIANKTVTVQQAFNNYDLTQDQIKEINAV